MLLGADGPRLADFGIARALDGTAVTGTGYVVGTAAYLAPEQVRGEWVGPEADVYALGLVLLESLTGRREYPGALVESATARLHRPPGIPAGLPFALDTALRAMTALDPADRPAAADVATMLAAGPSRRSRRRAGAHRRARPVSPRIAGAATILAVAAVVTAAALPPVEHPVPSVTPHDPVGPETRTVAVVPPRRAVGTGVGCRLAAPHGGDAGGERRGRAASGGGGREGAADPHSGDAGETSRLTGPADRLCG